MQTAAYFDEWGPDPHVAPGYDHIWTAALIVGDGDEDIYDMCVIGDPDDDGPTTYDVTGCRDGKVITFARGKADSWEEACRLAEVKACRASIRLVE